MKKVTLSLAITAIMIPLALFAQNQAPVSTNDKIDSIYSLQKKMYVESKTGPLANKNYGVELNIARLLMAGDLPSFSGTFSLFNVNRQAEIAFPVYIQSASKATNFSEFSLDCHYRYFLGKTQNGFYLSGFARYAYLHGPLKSTFDLFGAPSITPTSSENKLGIGVGIGYRIFSYKGLYWGSSLSFGRYIVGKSEKFNSDSFGALDDLPYIIDVELLKFGWAF